MYKLRYDSAVEAVWNSLPGAARAEFDAAIVETCGDPYSNTEPHDPDNEKDVRRRLVLRYAAVNILILDAPPIQRVYIRKIDPLT